MVERSGLGPNVNVGGHDLPSFVDAPRADRAAAARRRVEPARRALEARTTRTRCTSFPGIMQIPLLRSLFGNTNSTEQTRRHRHDRDAAHRAVARADARPTSSRCTSARARTSAAARVPTLISPDAPPPPQPAAATPPGAGGTGRGAGAAAGGTARADVHRQPRRRHHAPRRPAAGRGDRAAPAASCRSSPCERAGDRAAADAPAQIVVTAPRSALAVGGARRRSRSRDGRLAACRRSR